MTAAEIWELPIDQRMDAFIERYKDLDERTGCRSAAERNEMAEIADALMPHLIRYYERGE